MRRKLPVPAIVPPAPVEPEPPLVEPDPVEPPPEIDLVMMTAMYHRPGRLEIGIATKIWQPPAPTGPLPPPPLPALPAPVEEETPDVSPETPNVSSSEEEP